MSRGKERTTEEKKEIFRSLEPYFELGYSLNKACSLGGIPPSTAYDILDESEELRIKMHALQNLVNAEARKVVIESIKEKKDIKTAMWWLERKERSVFDPKRKEAEENGSFRSDKPVRMGVCGDLDLETYNL
jgi:hypothetical protein